ncbi:acyl-CoA dehydrogenase family protein [Variovorax ginsengisoli]|uniref:Alkylation response protein AidB-like acyl-CoA dehydrogenase n=1 Tax=Variovorax ginsengisoli TaxID=363844 RepID=A0ABT9S471_9BURK|nr:acyl-CoA dehydrogenase family protein [Variovorax ginsengisoli]MDP9898714.1 alkylation response protein AidB-like acyl-CoA dehydrogenase [Variovorax ginsengisoli]
MPSSTTSRVKATPLLEPDLSDPWVAKAAELRQAFHADAVSRDQAGGRPLAQVRLLRESGLPAARIGAAWGGGGASWRSVLRVVREFAKTDGSLAHLYGYHHLPLHAVIARGTPTQRDRLLRASVEAQWLWGNSGNAMSPTSSARRDGGAWVVDGFRPFSSGSHVADRLLIGWENEAGQRLAAVIPADRTGVIIEDDWDGIGQRQTGSGTVRFKAVRVSDDELLGQPGDRLTPFSSITTLLQQSVLLNVFLGGALGALVEARDYTNTRSRPWIHSGVEKHTDDPWVQRKYGELVIRALAATELAEDAAEQLDAAYAQGQDLSEARRGEAAIAIATANLYAGEVSLAVSSEIFEVMGARSATTSNGFDRFWRNTRTHTLHNPAEYKKRLLGQWLLTGAPPEPALYR